MRGRNRRGGAAVEFAMVAPVLLTLLAGVLEWGRFATQQLSVLHAVREGARMGSGLTDTWLEDDESGSELLVMAEDRVRAVLAEAGLDGDGATVNTSILTTEEGIELIHVEVAVQYQPLVELVPTPENLQGQLAMMVEEG